MITIFWFFFLGFIFLILGTFVIAGFSAAPWVPLWKKDIRRMLKLANVKPGEVVYDLGAGDGRIIIMASKEFGARSVGFEMAVLPYIIGYSRILLNRLGGKAKFAYKNFYKQSLADADVICTFLTPMAMKKLKPKFEKETKSGCRIVSYVFTVPGWQPSKISKENKRANIYLYNR